MGDNHDDLGRDEDGIRDLGSLILMYQNESSRVLWNGVETFVLFFERQYDFWKSLNFLWSLFVL